MSQRTQKRHFGSSRRNLRTRGNASRSTRQQSSPPRMSVAITAPGNAAERCSARALSFSSIGGAGVTNAGAISRCHPSPPRKRGSRPTAEALDPWLPASAGMTNNLLMLFGSFWTRGLAGEIAGAPDLFLQQQNTVQQSLCRWRTARHIDVDRYDPVAAAYHRVGIMIVAATVCAG